MGHESWRKDRRDCHFGGGGGRDEGLTSRGGAGLTVSCHSTWSLFLHLPEPDPPESCTLPSSSHSESQHPAGHRLGARPRCKYCELIPTPTLRGTGYDYYSHFTGRETEAQRGLFCFLFCFATQATQPRWWS